MEYQALYRKYRPKTFDDVAGQEIIIKTLKNIIKNNKLTHAYLFIGPRGTGKTSIAKIFAKTINCNNTNDGLSCEKCDVCINSNNNENVDIIEMDAASNNGVDEIREIKNHVTLLPTISKYKVYIIDEVHMLTTGAFNALLKTLEEPPKHVIFILATTEPHKIPLTIISRCQSFEFKPLSNNIIIDRLKMICQKEKINIDNESLELISIDSNGGMRDAIGLLDQLNAYTNGDIKYEDVLLLNGRISESNLIDLLYKIKEKDLIEVFKIVDKIENQGKNFIYISEDMIKLLRDEMILIQTKNESKINNIITKEKILKIILLINNSISDMKNTKDKRIMFDILLMKIYDVINENEKIEVKNNNIIETKKENKITKEEKQKEIINNPIYEELMDIRLNNILSKANKIDLENIKNKFKTVENEILNLEQLRIINLINLFDIKAASNDGIVLTTNNNNILNDVYNEILNIDNNISEIMNKNTKICVLLNDKWNTQRQIYVDKIKNKEVFEILDENEILNKIEKETKKNSEFDDLLEIGGE